MMNIRLATENRKAAALRLAEITGETSRYTKVPRCAYQVGPFFFEKDGTVTVPEDADFTPLRTLADEGLLEPFEAEAEPQSQEDTTAATEPDDADSATEDADALTISLPMDGFNPDSLDRLIKLVDSKATLIKKALGATRLTIRRVNTASSVHCSRQLSSISSRESLKRSLDSLSAPDRSVSFPASLTTRSIVSVFSCPLHFIS